MIVNSQFCVVLTACSFQNKKIKKSTNHQKIFWHCKVENVQQDSLDLIQSPSPSVKIQIIDGKVYMRFLSL